MFYESNELAHYGLKGMKWGQRRWQYDDGRFNDAGKARYFGQNSTHRPDSVRVLQGDKPKASSGSQSGSFDRDRAKKIAKNVAIGAAVVGGTVLVAYGGYKIHQAGGFSQVSKNLTAKMRETKIENLKLKEDFKAQKAQIKADFKAQKAEIKANTKKEMSKLGDDIKDFKLSLESGKREKALVKQLDDDELIALSSGKVKLTDLQGRKGRLLDPHKNIGGSITEASRHSSEYNKKYDAWLKDVISGKATRDDRPIADAGDLMDNPVTRDWWLNRDKGSNKNVVSTIKNAGNSIAKAAKSDTTKNAVKSVSDATIKTAKTAGSVTTKAAKSTAQIVSEYRREHPNTKMTAQQIVKSVSGNSSGSSVKSVPKLTLTPEKINAGTNFLAQATKSYQTVSQINRENSKSSSKAKKGQKAVDDYTKELLKKGA